MMALVAPVLGAQAFPGEDGVWKAPGKRGDQRRGIGARHLRQARFAAALASAVMHRSSNIRFAAVTWVMPVGS